jgi:hypothetical protein
MSVSSEGPPALSPRLRLVPPLIKLYLSSSHSSFSPPIDEPHAPDPWLPSCPPPPAPPGACCSTLTSTAGPSRANSCRVPSTSMARDWSDWRDERQARLATPRRNRLIPPSSSGSHPSETMSRSVRDRPVRRVRDAMLVRSDSEGTVEKTGLEERSQYQDNHAQQERVCTGSRC